MTSKKVGIKEIAEKADVSLSTVSRAFNNKDKVNTFTYKRIMAAAEELGYKFETELPTDEASQVLFVCRKAINNFRSKIINGAISSAEKHNYNVLAYVVSNDSVSDLLTIAQKTNSAGIILLNHRLSASDLMYLSSKISVVQCCDFLPEVDCSYVNVDDYGAGLMMVNHLISTGRKKIAFFGNFERYSLDRLSGYKQAMKSANLPIIDSWIIQTDGENKTSAGYLLQQLFSSKDKPDAIFAVSDEYALVVMNAAAKAGLRIPYDLSIGGFNNDDLSAITTPTLTTISQPYSQIGYIAMELLTEKILNFDSKNQKVILKTELIVRESTSLESTLTLN